MHLNIGSKKDSYRWHAGLENIVSVHEEAVCFAGELNRN